MLAKFKVGDLVIINGRCPQWIYNSLRHNRKRTIVGIYYNKVKRCRYFHVGTNKIGELGDFITAYPFRSYMLEKPRDHCVGRPALHGIRKENSLKPIVVKYLKYKGFETQSEVVFGSKRVDILATKGNRKMAIELKWRNWRLALKQALYYQQFIPVCIIAMRRWNVAYVDLDELRRLGIGLWEVNIKRRTVSIKLKSTVATLGGGMGCQIAK